MATEPKTLASKQYRDLLRLLEEMCRLHEELLAAVNAKMQAMSRGDTAGIGTSCERERGLAAAIHQREGLRRQMMDGIAEGLGLSRQGARALSLNQLAQRLVTVQRSQLISTGERLRCIVGRVARANAVAGAVSQGVLHHLAVVLGSVRPKADGSFIYAQDGKPVVSAGTMLLEETG